MVTEQSLQTQFASRLLFHHNKRVNGVGWHVPRNLKLGGMLMSRQQHEHASWQGTQIHVRPADAMRTWHPAAVVVSFAMRLRHQMLESLIGKHESVVSLCWSILASLQHPPRKQLQRNHVFIMIPWCTMFLFQVTFLEECGHLESRDAQRYWTTRSCLNVLASWTAPVLSLSECWDWGFIDWQR